MSKPLLKYYDIEPIYARDYTYSIIMGMRSNGKTYTTLKKLLKVYAETGAQIGIVRTWSDDFKGKGGVTLFEPMVQDGTIEEFFNGEYQTVVYKSQRWYLAKVDEKSKVTLAPEPFAWAFALTTMVHDKGSSYPKIKNVVYDEFMTDGYQPEGLVDAFKNCISTIVRDKDDVRIFMLANTVNLYSPFFDEMGIDTHTLTQGEIMEYRYADNKYLTVGVEYCAPVMRTEKQNKYFAFGRSSSSDMITTGKWQIPEYPRTPFSYKPKDIKFCAFVKHKNLVIQLDVVKGPYYYICVAHKKTTPIQRPDRDIIYDNSYQGLERNIIKNIYIDTSEFSRRLMLLKLEHKFYYDDNVTGETIRNWLEDSRAKK